MSKRKKRWIKGVVQEHEKGVFHRQLGIGEKKRIPKTLVQAIVSTDVGKTVQNPTKTGRRRYKVTTLLKRRANFALNVGYGRYPRRK